MSSAINKALVVCTCVNLVGISGQLLQLFLQSGTGAFVPEVLQARKRITVFLWRVERDSSLDSFEVAPADEVPLGRVAVRVDVHMDAHRASHKRSIIADLSEEPRVQAPLAAVPARACHSVPFSAAAESSASLWSDVTVQ